MAQKNTDAPTRVVNAARGGRMADAFDSPGALLRALRGYIFGERRRTEVRDVAGLSTFLETRASHVAQTSLYGYLRTRSGTLWPELFADDAFMVSVNAAKWRMWLACLSDLSVYAGGLLRGRAGEDAAGAARAAIDRALALALARAGLPAEAGAGFAEAGAAVRARLAAADLAAVADDHSAFSESPAALVEHAPVVEGLKALDREIVENSVAFRWQEVRRELRRALDAGAVARSAAAQGADGAEGAARATHPR